MYKLVASNRLQPIRKPSITSSPEIHKAEAGAIRHFNALLISFIQDFSPETPGSQKTREAEIVRQFQTLRDLGCTVSLIVFLAPLYTKADREKDSKSEAAIIYLLEQYSFAYSRKALLLAKSSYAQESSVPRATYRTLSAKLDTILEQDVRPASIPEDTGLVSRFLKLFSGPRSLSESVRLSVTPLPSPSPIPDSPQVSGPDSLLFPIVQSLFTSLHSQPGDRLVLFERHAAQLTADTIYSKRFLYILLNRNPAKGPTFSDFLTSEYYTLVPKVLTSILNSPFVGGQLVDILNAPDTFTRESRHFKNLAFSKLIHAKPTKSVMRLLDQINLETLSYEQTLALSAKKEGRERFLYAIKAPHLSAFPTLLDAAALRELTVEELIQLEDPKLIQEHRDQLHDLSPEHADLIQGHLDSVSPAVRPPKKQVRFDLGFEPHVSPSDPHGIQHLYQFITQHPDPRRFRSLNAQTRPIYKAFLTVLLTSDFLHSPLNNIFALSKEDLLSLSRIYDFLNANLLIDLAFKSFPLTLSTPVVPSDVPSLDYMHFFTRLLGFMTQTTPSFMDITYPWDLPTATYAQNQLPSPPGYEARIRDFIRYHDISIRLFLGEKATPSEIQEIKAFDTRKTGGRILPCTLILADKNLHTPPYCSALFRGVQSILETAPQSFIKHHRVLLETYLYQMAYVCNGDPISDVFKLQTLYESRRITPDPELVFSLDTAAESVTDPSSSDDEYGLTHAFSTGTHSGSGDPLGNSVNSLDGELSPRVV